MYSGRTAQNSVSLRCVLGWGLSVGYLNICVLVQHAVSQIVSANVLSMELVGRGYADAVGFWVVASCLPFFGGGAVHDHVLFFPHTCVSIMFCSRMRSKGSRFTLGVWGLRVCSLDVAFMFATVRGRPCEARMAVPMVSSAKGVTSGGCTCRVASFRVTGVALRDIQTCFVTCRKSFCVAGAILLRRFRKMRCSFCVRRSALDASIVILRGRRSTLDASCCVFVANHIVRAMSSGNKVQFPW